MASLIRTGAISQSYKKQLVYYEVVKQLVYYEVVSRTSYLCNRIYFTYRETYLINLKFLKIPSRSLKMSVHRYNYQCHQILLMKQLLLVMCANITVPFQSHSTVKQQVESATKAYPTTKIYSDLKTVKV